MKGKKIVSLISICLVALAAVGGYIVIASGSITIPLGNPEPHGPIDPLGNPEPHSSAPLLIDPLGNPEPH